MEEYNLDLDVLREEVTQNILSLFEAIDEQLSPAQTKFDEFRPVVVGFSLYHDALLRVLEIESTNETIIPVIESLEYIFEGWHEDDFSVEKAWDEIRLYLKKMINS